MATTSPTRVDDELFDSAKAVGAVMSRSAAQQIAHWARIGRELETGDSVSQRAIAKVLAGDQRYDGLSPEEQAVVRTEWTERMTARIAELNLAQTFSDEGSRYAELDENGQVVVRDPQEEVPSRAR